MNIVLFDDPVWRNQLKPLTLTRPIAELRIGIKTISEKWRFLLSGKVSFLTESYLQSKYNVVYSEANYYINASFLPDLVLIQKIKSLQIGQALFKNNILIAFYTDQKLNFGFELKSLKSIEYKDDLTSISNLPDLFLHNASQIEIDFLTLIEGRVSQPINDTHTVVYSPQNIFIEQGASIKASILNAENGPIYIGANAVIQEGSLLIGPVAVCENAMVAFGAKIRPNTTLGPVCRVGGEVGNSIFHGFSNKAHDGFLGNSYIGEWCNLGANTNNSNLKNDYKSVKLQNYNSGELEDTNELFCGTFMGDFAKSGISTMFNTGTSVGVSANVFGAGFQEKYIPSFTWGGKTEGILEYRFDKAIEVINATMSRRGLKLSEFDIEILSYIAKDKK